MNTWGFQICNFEKYYYLLKYFLPGKFIQLIFWLYMMVMLVLATVHGESIPSIFRFWDKAQHFSAFFVMALLGGWAFPRRKLNLLVSLPLFGAGIEFLQAFIPWRQGDVWDFFADALGVVFGIVIGNYFKKIYQILFLKKSIYLENIN